MLTSTRNTRTNTYQITIDINSDSSHLLLEKEKVPYPQSQSYFDEVTIKENKIEIVAKRSSIVDLKGIFLNHQSALYRQITKALIYYYCATQTPRQIESIKVQRFGKKKVAQEILGKSDIRQAVSANADLSVLKNINLEALKLIFSEGEKAHGYLFSITYLIKSLYADSKHATFENKWKAFNAIYKAIGGSTTDFACHRFIREDLIENVPCYPLILNKISKISVQDIRDNTRWIKFIHNDFSTIQKTDAFRDFILRNEDHRLVEIAKDTIGVRESNLKEKGHYENVTAHLKKHERTVNDPHLAATICIKYTYFARNKLIHAENIESGFRLVPLNKEENELTWLSGMLVLLIIDLINNCKRF